MASLSCRLRDTCQEAELDSEGATVVQIVEIRRASLVVAAPKGVHVRTPRTYEHITLHGKQEPRLQTELRS